MVVAAAILASILFPMNRHLPPSYLSSIWISTKAPISEMNMYHGFFCHMNLPESSDWSMPNQNLQQLHLPRCPIWPSRGKAELFRPSKRGRLRTAQTFPAWDESTNRLLPSRERSHIPTGEKENHHLQKCRLVEDMLVPWRVKVKGPKGCLRTDWPAWIHQYEQLDL